MNNVAELPTMKHLTVTLALAALAALAACATPDPAQREEVERTRPTCDGAADCTAKWDAAQLWVVKNAGFKIQTTTNVVIQTFGPSTVTADSTSVAVTVTREPLGGQRYRIVAHASCGNPFGCTPELVPTLLDFNRTVSAATAP